MKAVKKIKLSGLMASDAVKKIFDILQGDMKEPQVLFVGGGVRNALLSEIVSDIDLATVFSPQEVIAKLKRAGIKVVPTGIDHGTVTAVLNGESFQITTLRRDVDTDGRHAKVAFTDSWLEDAKRRDFTFNTLLADIKGNIYDPLGHGVTDLEKRKVVFVGDAEMRIREDYLRILRFFRFHAWYGKGKPDQVGLQAGYKLSKGLKHLSKERVTQEVSKILLSPRPGETLMLMQSNKVLSDLFSPKSEMYYFNAMKKIENLDSIVIGLLIMANFSKSGTRRIENSLRLSNSQQKQLDETVFYLKKFRKISDHDLKVLLYRAGPEIAELTLVSRLLLCGENPKKWLDVLRKMERPVLPLRGQDLLDQGMKPGPEIKKALEKFERLWIKNNFKV